MVAGDLQQRLLILAIILPGARYDVVAGFVLLGLGFASQVLLVVSQYFQTVFLTSGGGST